MPPEPVEVRWEVADDESMRRVVKNGRATATAGWAHSVHVEVEDLENLKVDFRDADAPAVAIEFVGTSIASGATASINPLG